jgi:hypothetical protein
MAGTYDYDTLFMISLIDISNYCTGFPAEATLINQPGTRSCR